MRGTNRTTQLINLLNLHIFIVIMILKPVKIHFHWNWNSIKQIDNLEKDCRFIAWNRWIRQKNIADYAETNLYNNSHFRWPYYLKIHQAKNSPTAEDNETDEDVEESKKQHKKKKINKFDPHHIKYKQTRKLLDKQQSKNRLKNFESLHGHKKQFKEKNKKYIRINKQLKVLAGKKLLKEFSKRRKSRLLQKIYKNAKSISLRNNRLMRSSKIFEQSKIDKRGKSYNKQRQKSIVSSEKQSDLSNPEEERLFSSKSFGCPIQTKKFINSKLKNKAQNKKSTFKIKSKSKLKKSQHRSQKSSSLLQEFFRSEQIKQKFSKEVLSEVPGRKQQAEKIIQLILRGENGSSTPVCLHGNTGCGKTSLITKILKFVLQEFPNSFSTAYLNCMKMWSVNHVYSGILYKLFGLKEKRSEKSLNSLFQCSQNLVFSTKSAVEPKEIAQKIHKTKIIVLDQIDHFIKDQTFIYNLLQWTHIKNSKIILIMISNILDLSVNLSAKIQSRMKFQSLVFRPYNSLAIEEILKYKYPQTKKIFQSTAIIYLSRKVASINSDIRLLQKIYEDVINQWCQANRLVNRDQNQHEHENDQNTQNVKSHQKQNSKDNSQQIFFNHPDASERHKQRQKILIQSMIKLSKVKKIMITDVQKSLFLTGELNNEQLPEIMKQYEVILKVLHKANKKQQVSYQIMNKLFLKHHTPSSQDIFLQMCELKDMGLIQFKQSSKNCDVTFQGFGIKINRQLHLMCPETDD